MQTETLLYQLCLDKKEKLSIRNGGDPLLFINLKFHIAEVFDFIIFKFCI